MNLVKRFLFISLVILCFGLLTLPGKNTVGTYKKKEQKYISLEINTDPLKPTVVSQLYGMAVSNLFDRMNVLNPYFIKFEKQLSPKILRWPGGGEWAYCHWDAKGYGYIKSEVASVNKIAADKYEKQGRFKIQSQLKVRYIDQLVELAKRTNSDVLLVGNILTASPREMLDQIRFFKKNGIKVIGIELGGEPYLKQLRAVFPTIEKYSSICIPYSDSIKKYFPEIPVGACAAPYGKIYDDNESNGFDNFFSNWNQELKKQKWYDAIIVHYYLPFACQNSQTTPDAIFNCAGNELNSNIDKFMSESADYYLKTFGSNRKMWITEWNIAIGGTKGIYGNTLFQAMFIVEYYLKLNELNYKNNNMIDIATYHNLDGGYLAAALLTTNLPAESYRDPESDTLIRRTSFFAHMIIEKMYSLNQQKTQIIVKDNNTIETDRNIHFESYYSKASNELFIYFINKSGIELNVSKTFLNEQSIKNTDYKVCYLAGEKTYAGFGKTNFFKQYKISFPCYWQVEKTCDDQLILPGFSVGYLKLNAN